MKNVLVIGGSKGIGKAILEQQSAQNRCWNISKTDPGISENVTHLKANILKDQLPDLDVEIDALVYCPGSINLKPINTLKEYDFRSDLEINLMGAVKAVKAYMPNLKKSENASLLFFSTVAVSQGMPFHSSIAAAKGAVEGLARSLAAELAPKIKVNCIAPSIVDTDLAQNLLKNDQAREKAEQRHPLKRILKPSEIADVANMLINHNQGITGQVIHIDNGMSTINK